MRKPPHAAQRQNRMYRNPGPGLLLWALAAAALLAAGTASPVRAQQTETPPPPDTAAATPAAPPAGTQPPAQPPAEAPPETAGEAQQPVEGGAEPAPEAAEEPSPSEKAPPSGVAPPAGGEVQAPRDSFLPRLDLYFPEGDFDLRVNRLINKVFFEGQVKYNFLEGDITAFMRYRYYGYNRTTQFTVFDSVEFESIDEFSSDFERVRGTLLLFQWPHSFHNRTSLLTELDRIASNKPDLEFVERPGENFIREGKTNTFVRYSYQLGTPSDTRSNALAGETRARRERLFTAFREIGPGGAGFTGAVTYGFPLGGLSDFNYVKLEFETLKRFDLTPSTFMMGRLRGGSFPYYEDIEFEGRTPVSQLDRWTIPRGEYFTLDGRDKLLGLGDSDAGTDQIITTWELFTPWFLDAEHDFLKLTWENWYWVFYSGAGNIGLDPNIFTDLSSYVLDVGVGFESSFRLKKYRFFVSGIVAHALNADVSVEAHLSVKSYR